MLKHSILAVTGFASLLAGGLLFTQQSAQAQTIVKLDGSSTVFPVSEAVAEEFQASTKGKIRVQVGSSGSGGGFKKFARGETDISNASRPILTEEIAACKAAGIDFIEIPVCFDALTVAVHPSNTWATSMTVAELKKLWEPAAQGVVMKWSQIREGWPDQAIKLFGAGTDSGTFDYFTEAVVGKAKSSRSDFTASEDDNTLVQGIEGDKNSLGYIPYAYFEPHSARMKAVGIDNEKGLGPMLPNKENLLAGKYSPLARPLFIYVSAKAAEKPEVQQFVKFYLENVKELATEVKYIPLPDAAYEEALKRFESRKVGTIFGGVPEVGLTAEELVKRELK